MDPAVALLQFPTTSTSSLFVISPDSDSRDTVTFKRVELAHHWLVGMRGGEKVLEEVCSVYPDASIYTLVAFPEKLSQRIRSHRIVQSPLHFIPWVNRIYKSLLPLFPSAISALRIPADTRLVFSSDASLIKGLRLPPGVPHICYCHSPPRYLWDLTETYLSQTADLGRIGKFIFSAAIPRLREFDRLAAQRVTHFIANSIFVQNRIKQFYGRDSVVIHPPVDVDLFRYDGTRKDFYLVVSELTPYKRVDLLVKSFAHLKGRRLVVVGTGSELRSLRQFASPNIEFLGRQPFETLKELYESCRAFLYPQIEDFGITAVEAQAAGSPVIAFRQGGALETVIEGETGLFFDAQTPEAIVEAVLEFERQSNRFSALTCRINAERFRADRFRERIVKFIAETVG